MIEPKEFRGLAWGSSEADLKAKSPSIFCINTTNPVNGQRLCREDITIGSVPTQSYYFFRDNKFVHVSLRFEAKGYDTIRPIFIEKYGSPTRSKQEEVKSRGGLTFTNEILEWRGSTVEIELEKYGSKVTESSAGIRLLSDEQRQLGEYDQLQKKGAGDL